MSLSYHLLGRNAIHSSTSTSTASLIDLALSLSGMSTPLIAESVVYVILKSAMHSCKFSVALWYSKQLWLFFTVVFTDCKYRNIQEAAGKKTKNPTTKANKRRHNILQPRLHFLEHWHSFYSKKSEFFPTSLHDSWLCCSVFCFDTWLAHFKILWECTMISDFAETSQSVQRPKQEIASEKLHV